MPFLSTVSIHEILSRISDILKSIYIGILRVRRVVPITRNRCCCAPGHEYVVHVRCHLAPITSSPHPLMHIWISISVLEDLDIIRQKLDSTLFPGISSDITVHSGFSDDQAL